MPAPRRPGRIRAPLSALLLVLGLGGCSNPPPQVDEITLVNPTEHTLDVQVSGAAANTWLPIGSAGAGAETVSAGVIDQGATWTFRFLFEGEVVGELTIERAALEAADWRVEIPDAVEDRIPTLTRKVAR